MIDLLKESVALYNLPVTVFLGMILLYWMFVMVGLLDLDTDVDMDLEADVDADLNLDLDADMDVDGHPKGSLLMVMLRFFNAVEIPAVIFLSFLSLSMWVVQVVFNMTFNAMHSVLLSMAFLVPNFLGSLFIAKILTIPFRPFFRAINKAEEHVPVVGREGLVKSARIDEKYGQVEVTTDGAPLLVNARVPEGSAPIAKGAKVLLYRRVADKDFYYVRVSELIEEERAVDVATSNETPITTKEREGE